MRFVTGCMVALAAVLALLTALIFALQFSLNRTAEERIWETVTQHYKTDAITVNRREYWGPGGYFEGYMWYSQFCYDLSIRQPVGRSETRIVMVSGDDDGGSWSFSGEFASMEACKTKFFRG